MAHGHTASPQQSRDCSHSKAHDSTEEWEGEATWVCEKRQAPPEQGPAALVLLRAWSGMAAKSPAAAAVGGGGG